MAPIAATALVGRILAPTQIATTTALPSPSLPLPSPPTHTPLTPALLFRRLSHLIPLSISTRDTDNTSNDNPNNHNSIIYPAIVGGIFLFAVIGYSRDYFRKGGNWKTYFKGWGKLLLFFLLITVLLPLTLLGCVINFNRDQKKKKLGRPLNAQGQAQQAARPLQPANNVHAKKEPPPPTRPQMPLDAVVMVPDMPDQEDPDAVEGIASVVQRPAPTLQKGETTAEATASLLDATSKTTAAATSKP